MPSQYLLIGKLIDIKGVTSRFDHYYLILHVDAELEKSENDRYKKDPFELVLMSKDLVETAEKQLHPNDLVLFTGVLSSREREGQRGVYYQTSILVDDFEVLGSAAGVNVAVLSKQHNSSNTTTTSKPTDTISKEDIRKQAEHFQEEKTDVEVVNDSKKIAPSSQEPKEDEMNISNQNDGLLENKEDKKNEEGDSFFSNFYGDNTESDDSDDDDVWDF